MNITLEELKKRHQSALRLLEECRVCPRQCGVNRLQGEKGYCQLSSSLVISSSGPHFGEEPPLVGRRGSGTIFFTSCNLDCMFCQNYDISHLRHGEEVTPEELATIMLHLQQRGCHNINLVTPTPQTPQILQALYHAQQNGLHIPVVYNCGGYEPMEILKLLEGVVDIYMPDFKYSDEETAFKLSGIRRYPQVAKEALKEMHRQVGDLEIDSQGIAQRGLLIRHLVLPNNLAGTAGIVRFIAHELSPHSYVNIMDQYRPLFKAESYPPVNRSITGDEFQTAIDLARKEGLYRGFSSRRLILWF